MSHLKESKVNQVTGRSRHSLRRLGFERTRGKGWHEPYESRGSRTDLWGARGEIPPVYPAGYFQQGRVATCKDSWHKGNPRL